MLHKNNQIFSLASTWGLTSYFGNPTREESVSESDFTKMNLRLAKIGKHRTAHAETNHTSERKKSHCHQISHNVTTTH